MFVIQIIENQKVSLHEAIRELIMGDPHNIGYVSFFIENEGMTRIPFDEFDRLTSDIQLDASVLKDVYKLISMFGDNFCFVFNDGTMKYIYYVQEPSAHEYEMVSIDHITENPRWKTYEDEKKKDLIFKTLHFRN